VTATADIERDTRELHALRERAMAADNAADASAMADLLAQDIVIMPQGVPVIEGRAACLEFVRAVLIEFPMRRVEYFSDELIISGGVAIDRGHFTQITPGARARNPVMKSARMSGFTSAPPAARGGCRASFSM